MELVFTEKELQGLLMQLSEVEDDYESLIIELSDTLKVPRKEACRFVRRWSAYDSILQKEMPNCLIENSKSLIQECVKDYPQLGELAEPQEVENSILGELVKLEKDLQEKREIFVGSHLCGCPSCENTADITLEDYRCLVGDLYGMMFTVSHILCGECIANEEIDIPN